MFNKFIIRHLGSVDDLRDPRPMMFALQSLIEEKSIDVADLAIEFIVPVNNSFRVFVEENNVRYVLGLTGQGIINNPCPPPETWFGSPSMSWVNPAFVLKDLIKTAEKIVEEDKKIEFAQAEAVRLTVELKAKQEAEAKATTDKTTNLALETMQAKLNSLLEQITALNAKLTASEKSLSGVNAKLKKICAAKPKPKGC